MRKYYLVTAKNYTGVCAIDSQTPEIQEKLLRQEKHIFEAKDDEDALVVGSKLVKSWLKEINEKGPQVMAGEFNV